MSYELADFFNEQYEQYYNNVVRFVVSKCSDIQDVQDIVQGVFVELYSIIQSKGINYISNMEAMLIKIAKNKLYRHYSLIDRLKIKLSRTSTEDVIDNAINIELSDIDINEQVDNSIMVERIWSIIRLKSKDTQKVFYMYYYCDMTLREIAETMKISESNVKHKIYRTLQDIRKVYIGGD